MMGEKAILAPRSLESQTEMHQSHAVVNRELL